MFPLVMNLLMFKITPLIAPQQPLSEKASVTWEINSLHNHLKENFVL